MTRWRQPTQSWSEGMDRRIEKRSAEIGKKKAKKPAVRKPPKRKRKRLNQDRLGLVFQAELFRGLTGWPDTPQYRALSLGAIQQLHEDGYRIAKLKPKPIIEPKPTIQYADGTMP